MNSQKGKHGGQGKGDLEHEDALSGIKKNFEEGKPRRKGSKEETNEGRGRCKGKDGREEDCEISARNI